MEGAAVSFLAVTIPVSLLLAGALLALVIRAARNGEFEDWEGPSIRHFYDDDATPEREGDDDGEQGAASGRSTP